jgi:GxxExxY protein
MTQRRDPDLIARVIACATEVHRETGPGLTKDLYENCLEIELNTAGLAFERGRILPLIYDGHELDFTIQTDFIVAGTLLLQVEAEEVLEPAHDQKLRSSLWMGGFPSALLLNFNVVDMADGVIEATPYVPIPDDDLPIYDVFDDPGLGSEF